MAATINGKEYGLFYSVGAHIDYQDFLVNNPDVSMTHGFLQLACFMNREYNVANGIKEKALRMEDLRKLPKSAIGNLIDEVKIQMEIDSEISVEAAPGKEGADVEGS